MTLRTRLRPILLVLALLLGVTGVGVTSVATAPPAGAQAFYCETNNDNMITYWPTGTAFGYNAWHTISCNRLMFVLHTDVESVVTTVQTYPALGGPGPKQHNCLACSWSSASIVGGGPNLAPHCIIAVGNGTILGAGIGAIDLLPYRFGWDVQCH